MLVLLTYVGLQGFVLLRELVDGGMSWNDWTTYGPSTK